jgi:hypothetical protein
VWNDPFYTYNAANLQDWTHAAAKLTDTVHFGVATTGLATGIAGTDYFLPQQPLYVQRQDAAGNVVGNWNMPDSRVGGYGLSHFKHFAAARGGIYKITWNGELPSGSPTSVGFELSLFKDAADTITLGVAWPNGTPCTTVYLRWRSQAGDPPNNYELNNTAGSPPLPLAIRFNSTGMTSRADVIADTTGTKFWQDTTNNTVWIKLKGGMVYQPVETWNFSTTENKYRPLMLMLDSRAPA